MDDATRIAITTQARRIDALQQQLSELSARCTSMFEMITATTHQLAEVAKTHGDTFTIHRHNLANLHDRVHLIELREARRHADSTVEESSDG